MPVEGLRAGENASGATGRTFSFVTRCSSAVLAGLLFLASEAVVVALVHHETMAGPWELRVALTRLVPVGILAALPVLVFGAVLASLLDHARRPAGRALLAVVVAVAAGIVAYGVSSGRLMQALPVRVTFIAIVAALGAATSWAIAPRLNAVRERASGWFAIACTVFALVVSMMNAAVLPRLYPAFHHGMAVITLVLAAWMGDLLWRYASPKALVATAAVAVIGASAAVPWAARDLTSWDNMRVLYVAHAPLLGYAVKAAAEVQPPTDQDRAVDRFAMERTGGERRWLDWKGRDIVLVTVDALRADHIGFYGYERNITPQIDQLAHSGVVFERAYTPMPHTSYAVTSMLTSKYIRPLLLQRVGRDSDTWAGIMRIYGYRTSAFYPPSVFSVDTGHFDWAQERKLDFEYNQIEYLTGRQRLQAVQSYLQMFPADQPLFMWVHLFDPHEPYDAQSGYDFGDRDIDRYDSEIAYTDAVIGELVHTIRSRRPDPVIIVSADHGEEFGDHGGYYHGTTVYEEQVRVPMIIAGPGVKPSKVTAPVQLIDMLPTVLRALDIPITPRMRGHDLGPWLVGQGEGTGFAFSESHDYTMLGIDRWRLICERKVDACRLFDIVVDPDQRADVSTKQVERVGMMRSRLRQLESSHGQYELAGARLEGKALPPALVRGIAGDADAARDVAALLDDADVVIRRRSGEVLFQLRVKDTAPALSLAMGRDEDVIVRRWCALSLARMGQPPPLARELIEDEDLSWQRHAALALADVGDDVGEEILVSWLMEPGLPTERAKEVVAALATIRAGSAVEHLLASLDILELRPFVARALGEIGERDAKATLLEYFARERYANVRLPSADALVKLGATRELVRPLGRFLGVPDPMREGVRVALDAGIMQSLGGPDRATMAKLGALEPSAALARVTVPKGGNGEGFKVLVRARSRDADEAEIRLSPSRVVQGAIKDVVARLDPDRTVTLRFGPEGWRELHATLDVGSQMRGRRIELAVVPSANLEIAGFVVVPMHDEIPAPPPEPWQPDLTTNVKTVGGH